MAGCFSRSSKKILPCPLVRVPHQLGQAAAGRCRLLPRGRAAAREKKSCHASGWPGWAEKFCHAEGFFEAPRKQNPDMPPGSRSWVLLRHGRIFISAKNPSEGFFAWKPGALVSSPAPASPAQPSPCHSAVGGRMAIRHIGDATLTKTYGFLWILVKTVQPAHENYAG